MPTRTTWLTLAALTLLVLCLAAAQRFANEYQVRLLHNAAIFITLAVGYNLVNGVCGQLHLGPNAFITLGAYSAALLTLTPAEKAATFLLQPLVWPFSQLALPLAPALLAGGLTAAGFAVLTGFPVFRVRGDYLAIVTLGFGEVVRVLANNLQYLTNGPLGLKGLHPLTSLAWSWGVAVAAVAVVSALVRSSYGRAMQAIREDETAARAMGVDTFRHLMLAYVLSAFLFGMAGGLLAHLITTISPSLFSFFLTFNLLIIIVVGGLGSTTGAVLSAILFTLAGEWLRVVEEPRQLLGLTFPGIPGMRMVIFSCLLLAVILFFRRGLLGRREFSWEAAGAWIEKRRWRLGGRRPRGKDSCPGPRPSTFHAAGGEKEGRSGGRQSLTPAPPPPRRGRQGASEALLSIHHLGVRFGGLLALEDLNLTVPQGGLYGLIGPNGAGKTTAFNLISGFLCPTSGSIRFAGQDLAGLPPHRITTLGVARTFQNIRLFNDLTVLDNVLVGRHCRGRAGWWEAVLHLPRYRREERAQLHRARDLLAEVGLDEVRQEKAGQLPYGHQRRLEIARALATEPRLLLLDEPAAGLNPQETLELKDFLQDLQARHSLTLLLIEHNLRLVMNLCQHLTVLDHGLTIAQGPPAAIQRHPDVIRAYLGKG